MTMNENELPTDAAPERRLLAGPPCKTPSLQIREALADLAAEG